MSHPDLAVLVPVLNRPHRVEPTLQAFTDTVPGCRVVFIADPDDERERDAIRAVDGIHILLGGNYAEKIRAGVKFTNEAMVFTGADDLEPVGYWYEHALEAMVPPVEVVGINDLIPRGRDHQTHFLMTRQYAETPTIDGEPGPFFGGYQHWYCDDELVATARKRNAYAYAPNAIVRHLHPQVGLAPDDPTYASGRATSHLDRNLFRNREPLWT